MRVFKFLFGMKSEVQRGPYLKWGIILLILKYLGEALIYGLETGNFLLPIHFFSPFARTRYPDIDMGSMFQGYFALAIILWSLPFIWVGFGMSLRRSVNAGLSPWLGLIFFVPFLNYLFMLGLSIAPVHPRGDWKSSKGIEKPKVAPLPFIVLSPFILMIAFIFLGLLLVWINKNFSRNYSLFLFIGVPLILSMIQGCLLNKNSFLGFKKTASYASLSMVLLHLILLLFSLEGALCLVMFLPFALILGIVGSFFGMAISRYSQSGFFSFLVLLFTLFLEVLLGPYLITSTYKDVVYSKIKVRANPEVVWKNVVEFSDLPPTKDWLFRLGIAYPVRARIEGQGVGATRYCEFSTGAFVEPITVWEKPKRLGFSVQSQPKIMKRISLYDRPKKTSHLKDYFRSFKGEFRLVSDGGDTILEGRTWYEMSLFPHWYWRIYVQWFIHKIHQRVLRHIKTLSEWPHI